MINWPEIARCFSVLRPVRWIDPRARSFLEHLGPDQPVVVACSGGADSVFLVLAASALLGPERLRIAHFNHGTRGSESDDDASFVTGLAGSLNINCFVGKMDADSGPSEAALREARYAWLTGVYHQQNAASLLLGHHADDVLETQLMGLLTGSGPSGLCSPMPVRVFPDGHVRVRPLLPMKRTTIEKTLTSLGVPWREDSSNTDTRYTRNWIRRELLPRMAERMPQDIYAGSQRTRHLMQDAVDALDACAAQLCLDLSDPGGFSVNNLISLHEGIIRRVLFAWWMRHYGSVDLPANAADTIIRLIAEGSPGIPVSVGTIACMGRTVQALVINNQNFLLLQNERGSDPVPWQRGCHWAWRAGPVFLPVGGSIAATIASWDPGQAPYCSADPRSEAWVQQCDGPILVRQWQPGDRYQPLGAPGSRKLQDIFSDAKLNSEQKQALPVLLNNKGQILWVPGFPPAEHAKITSGINSALRLTYRPL